MFSSPAIRVYSSENADNLVQRKPGNNVLVRKPFLDRAVNSKTPDIHKLKSKITFTKDVTTIEKPKSPKEELDSTEYMFSHKEEEDTFDDILPKPCFNKTDILNVLRKFCNPYDTPPPSPVKKTIDIDPIFLELPSFEPSKPVENKHLWNESFDVEIPTYDESIDEEL